MHLRTFTENGKTASDTFVVSVKKINRTENLNKSDYTEVSWAALEKALAAANKAMESDITKGRQERSG